MSLSPEVHHAIGLALVGAGAIAAGIAVIDGLGHARCRRLDAPMRALIAARDCATVVRRVDELDAIDPGIRFTLTLRDPGVAKCLKATEEPAMVASPPAPVSPAEDDCHRRRRLASQAAQETTDVEERTKILTNLPDCSKVAPPPSP